MGKLKRYGIRLTLLISLVSVSGVAAATQADRANCIELAGSLTQGGLVWGKVAPGSRVSLDGESLDAAKARQLPRPDLLQGALAGFEWPALGPISGVYGSQRYYNGTAGNPHYGVDVAVPVGTPVYAPAAGVVTLAEPDLLFSGGTIILDHGFRLSSAFLRLSNVLVEVGQEIDIGDLIGEVGATGRATGAHLDWRMNWRSHRIDPQLLVPPMPKP
jgi:murein DD-endopeptidase MepM/ murein hydrolase activator NlpD